MYLSQIKLKVKSGTPCTPKHILSPLLNGKKSVDNFQLFLHSSIMCKTQVKYVYKLEYLEKFNTVTDTAKLNPATYNYMYSHSYTLEQHLANIYTILH